MMGGVAAKPVREAPVRYVAKQLPRLDHIPVEQRFRKPHFTAQGINTRQEDIHTEPRMYVETSKEASSTELTDHVAPRWYLNTYMEMTDNLRQDRNVISGNLPYAWERDKHEPYALVRGRIDAEDLAWLLQSAQRQRGVHALLEHTKLEPQVLQDILDTVELPRTQYRNYRGKLHKSIEDVKSYAEVRQEQVARARECEALRQIGYSESEIAQEAQYLTNRPRGVRTLDELGASGREEQRRRRVAAAGEMEELLEQRRIEQLERSDPTTAAEAAAGGEDDNNLTESDMLAKPDRLLTERSQLRVRTCGYKQLYAADVGRDATNQAKFHWWLQRSRRIHRAVDRIHGVPVYHERLSASESQMQQQLQEAAAFNFKVGQAQGAKGFADPRVHLSQVMDIVRDNQDEQLAESSVEVREDGVREQLQGLQFPHTRDHPETPAPPASSERYDTYEHVDATMPEYFGQYFSLPKNKAQTTDAMHTNADTGRGQSTTAATSTSSLSPLDRSRAAMSTPCNIDATGAAVDSHTAGESMAQEARSGGGESCVEAGASREEEKGACCSATRTDRSTKPSQES